MHYSNTLVQGRSIRSLALEVAFGLAAVVTAIFFGLIAYTANPLIIALAAGFVGGPVLLLRPQYAVTLLLGLGLTMGILLALAGPAFHRLSWLVSVLGFFLLMLSIVRLVLERRYSLLIWAGVLFIALAAVTTIAQWHGLAQAVAGTKRYFQGFGLFLALAVLGFTPQQLGIWRKIILGIALLQIVACLYQVFVLVPARGGFGAGATTTDVVAGTFGGALVGGSPNSVMVVFLLVVTAFLFARWKENTLSSSVFVVLVAVCLSPLFLGEVKIAIVMLPVVFLVVLRDELFKRPLVFVSGVLLIAVLTVSVGYVYLEWIINKPLSKAIQDTLEYNFYDKGYGFYFLNRTSVLKFWWNYQGAHDPVGFLFGNGMGSSYLSTDTLVPGHLAAQWPRHGIGLTTASTLLWDLGILGFLSFFMLLLAAWMACTSLRRTSIPWIRADASAAQAAIALFSIMVFYNSALVDIPSMEILFAAILGYIAYLKRHGWSGEK